jgi:6-phosphogluconolactonase (cycloisomerase 2 family)
MRRAGLAGLFLATVSLLTGCKGFWDAPSGNTSFSLSNSANITVSPGATTNNTSTISVTPANSFTGTVDLTCSVTAPTNASNPATCSLSPTSVDLSSTSAMTATLTATTASTTTAGVYTITVTGSSGGVTATTAVCALVGNSSGSCSTTASTSGVFYVLNASTIAGYTISSGSLAGVSGSSYSLNGATAIAIAPSGNFLYVGSEGSGIVLYTISSSTGALGQGNSAVFGDTVAQALQIDPSGTWLLDLDGSVGGSGTLTAYPILSTGAQDTSRTLQQVSLAGAAPQQMAISPNGTLISVALGGNGTQSFSFNATSATPIGTANSLVTKPYGSDGAAISVAIDPQNRLLYIGETLAFPTSTTNLGALRVFTIGANLSATPSLSELNYKAPYAPLGTGPHAILPDPAGKYVYVASWQTLAAGAITGYSVTTSALTQIGSSTVATGTGPSSLAEDSTDSYVLAASNLESPFFNAYTFDATTPGQLDPASITGSPAASNPIAIVAMPKQ